jgi:hypothetical protein
MALLRVALGVSQEAVLSSQVLREISSPQFNKFEDKVVPDDIQDNPRFVRSILY